MQANIFDRVRVVDVDTHVSEPYDLWTSRVSSKWGDLVPHVTSMSPGPRSIAEHPRDYVQRVWADLPEDTARKVFHDNAARIYHLD